MIHHKFGRDVNFGADFSIIKSLKNIFNDFTSSGEISKFKEFHAGATVAVLFKTKIFPNYLHLGLKTF